jgi:hypothetical protein
LFTALTQAEIADGAALLVGLYGELGRNRGIGPMRLLRPLAVAIAVIPLFLGAIATQGTSLTIELAGVTAGLVGGFAALSLIRVFRDERTGRPASCAGWPYALVWVVVFGARAAFSYGCVNWFPTQLEQWRAMHHLTDDAITNGLVLMASVMVATRTIGIAAAALAASPKRPPTALTPTASAEPPAEAQRNSNCRSSGPDQTGSDGES